MSVELTIEASVECDTCGSSLEATVSTSGWSPTIKVTPCSSCITDAKQEGDDEGYNRGVSESEGGE